MNIEEARKLCEQFATKHKLIFEDEGECGFGRECVGFLDKRGHWLDFNPTKSDGAGNREPMVELQCAAVEPPAGVDNYHKHDCMAVLGRGDEAIIGLAKWVQKINSAGNVQVVEYKTRATGMQAMISGVIGYAILAG